MALFGKSNKAHSRIDSLIGAGTCIEGNVKYSGGLRVDGEIRGNVVGMEDTSSTLMLSEHAKIEGEIRVSHVVINGTVVGPVHAGEYLELQGKSKVCGDVHYRRLEMQLGAVVEGRLVHEPEGAAEKVVAFKSGTAD